MDIGSNLSEKAQQDFKLVLKAIDGDQKAYADLLGRYRDAIYFMLLKMVNNAVDAEDLTIEAFGKAFKSINQYVPNYAFSTWLFKIATNNAIDFIRKRRANLVSIDQSHDEEGSMHVSIQDNEPDPEESIIIQQNVKMMRSIVAKLKPRYRRLIELRYFSEYSYQEISIELDLPIGTVKAQLFRARELLLNILKNTSSKI
jgi:RNA polymerase sigma factor (sigma-70 family)